MPKIVRLTESDLTRLVRRIIKEDVSLEEENYNLHQAVKFIARGTEDCHKKSATGINCDNIIMDSITSNSDEKGDEISFKIKFSSDSFEIPFHSELEGLTKNPQELIDEVKDRIENRVIVGDENVNNGIQGRTFRKTTVEYIGVVNGAHTFLVKQTSGRVSREEKLSESDLTKLVKRIILESYREVDDLDSWIENNSDYISTSSLEEVIKELFNLTDVTSYQSVEEDEGGDEYGENWSKILITIQNNGDDLVKVWVTSDYRYDYGKNASEFDKRFYFNEYAL